MNSFFCVKWLVYGWENLGGKTNLPISDGEGGINFECHYILDNLLYHFIYANEHFATNICYSIKVNVHDVQHQWGAFVSLRVLWLISMAHDYFC